MIRKLIGAAVLVGALAFAGEASAGSIYLTGHDVDFHSNQNGYANVILNWLRGAGTGSEIAAASYDILVLRSTGVGSFLNPAGFGSVTQADPTTFDWTTLGLYDVIEVASHVNCGGCALTTAGSNAINANASAIETYFNLGGDIYGNSGATLATYYSFLPPTAVATGASIGGSSGFTATPAGVAIGITDPMINGHATHNRFSSFDPVFTVFEIRAQTSGNEIISLGVRDARIIEDDIVTDDIVTDDTTDGDGTVPEPASLALLGLGLAGAVAARRRRAKA